nr:carboxypeptidase-like regulatory domain-containing protein [Planctomycetota bacterium]
MGPRLVFLGLLLFLGLPASPALVEAKEPAPTGSVQISTRADGKGVSATVELYVLMDMEVLTGTPQAIGSLATDMMHNALEGGGKPARKAKTDAKGKTSLSGLAKGLYAVRARGGPAKERTAWFLLPTSRSTVKVTVDLSRGPHRIRGRVVPIEDATFSGHVLLMGLPATGWPLMVGVAHPTRPVKADGTFGFDGVPHGAYQVVAIDDERGVVMEQPCKTGAEEPVEVSIPPQKRFVISGRVRAKATGKPVAGATIGLRERLESTETTRTDAEGRFTLPSSRGARTVEITADGFATTKVNARWQLDAPKREDGSATLDASVALERAATIRGRALVARGEKPAAGARVVLMRLPNVTASDSLMPGLAMRRLLASMQVHFVVADAEGRYEAAQLQSGQYVVGSQSEAWVSENLLDLESFDDASGLLQVEPGSVHDIDVRLVPTAKIVGRVLGPDGRGMRGVPVIACSEGFGAIGGSTAATVSESGGRFTLDAIVPRHPYEVIAISRKRSPGRSKPVTLAPGEARGIELRLQEAAWLDVRATMGPKQEPRPSTFVSVGPIESSPALRHVAQQGITDAKGHVRLGPLPRGLRMKATILDDIAGIESRELEPFEGTETTRPLHVDVGAEKMLEGRLVVPRGADPTKVHLVATDPGRLGLKDGSGKIEKDGRFRWVLFLRKRAMLRATLRHRGALYHGELEANGGSFGLTIPLHKVKPDPAEGTWLLRVKGPDGKPIPHARVTRVDRTDQVRDPSDPNS